MNWRVSGSENTDGTVRHRPSAFELGGRVFWLGGGGLIEVLRKSCVWLACQGWVQSVF